LDSFKDLSTHRDRQREAIFLNVNKLFIALIKDTTYMTSITINGNGGLISKRDSSSQPMDVQENKISKHKSEQQTIKKKKTRNNKVLNILKYNNYNILLKYFNTKNVCNV
jgi:hypothetical protein